MSDPNGDRPPAPAADLDWCHEAVQGVSRTFAITVDVLDEPMASYICLGYLLCRVPDTVEDDGRIPADEQAALLRTYEAALDPDDATTMAAFADAVEPWVPPPADRCDDWTVVAEAERIDRTFRAFPADVRAAVRPPVRELVRGMADFVERYADRGGLRLRSADELEEYCHYAAGTVGTLITNLVCRGDIDSETEDRLRGRAEAFGQLLQLVNVAKDVYVDYREENNVYLPAAWLRSEGVGQEQIDDPSRSEAVVGVVRRTVDHARSFLDDAQGYLETVPERDGNRLEAWLIPYLLAVGTLRELSDRPEDALSEEGVKVSRREVHAVIEAAVATDDREALDDLRQAVAEQPLHRASSVGPSADPS